MKTVDQTSGAVQRQAVKPSTIGSAQRGAEATRAANAGSSRRAGPGNSTAPGAFKMPGKGVDIKAFMNAADMKVLADAAAAKDVHDKVMAARDSGLEVPETLIDQCEYALGVACQAIALIMARIDGILAQSQAEPEQSTDDAGQPNEGVVETNTGEVPRENGSAGALDAAAMDEGQRAVLDHMGKVSAAEPGTFQNPHVLDAARMEATRKRANAIVAARNPERVRFGMDDEPLTDYSQLSFMKDRAAE
jgi:hypothetical protein